MKFQLVFLLVTVIQASIVVFPTGLEDGVSVERNFRNVYNLYKYHILTQIGGETNSSSTNLTTIIGIEAKRDSASTERKPLVLPLKMLGHPHEIVELLLKSGKVVVGGVIGEFEVSVERYFRNVYNLYTYHILTQAGGKKKSPETNPTTLIKVEDVAERPAQQGFPLKMLGHPYEIIDLIIKYGKPVIGGVIGEYEETSEFL